MLRSIYIRTDAMLACVIQSDALCPSRVGVRVSARRICTPTIMPLLNSSNGCTPLHKAIDVIVFPHATWVASVAFEAVIDVVVRRGTKRRGFVVEMSQSRHAQSSFNATIKAMVKCKIVSCDRSFRPIQRFNNQGLLLDTISYLIESTVPPPFHQHDLSSHASSSPS